MADKIIGYGIFVYHLGKDAEAPTAWDGWYSDRALAKEMLRWAKRQHPEAYVRLVAQIDAT
jgi:hypothetical protein